MPLSVLVEVAAHIRIISRLAAAEGVGLSRSVAAMASLLTILILIILLVIIKNKLVAVASGSIECNIFVFDVDFLILVGATHQVHVLIVHHHGLQTRASTLGVLVTRMTDGRGVVNIAESILLHDVL